MPDLKTKTPETLDFMGDTPGFLGHTNLLNRILFELVDDLDKTRREFKENEKLIKDKIDFYEKQLDQLLIKRRQKSVIVR